MQEYLINHCEENKNKDFNVWSVGSFQYEKTKQKSRVCLARQFVTSLFLLKELFNITFQIIYRNHLLNGNLKQLTCLF
jgi:hypothetical protein